MRYNERIFILSNSVNSFLHHTVSKYIVVVAHALLNLKVMKKIIVASSIKAE